MVRPGLRRPAAGLTTLVVLLAGCSGDDGRDVQAYCDMSREFDAQEDFPTPEQLDRLAEAAPEEIRGDVEFVVERFKTAIETGDPAGAFDNAEVEQRLEPIEAFEARECDSGEGQGEG